MLSPAKIDQMRAESDRLMHLCLESSAYYRHRILWEIDGWGFSRERQPEMERVIKKLEPVSDLSPLFMDLAYDEAITSPVSTILGEPVELFEDKLNLKLPNGGTYPWHQDWSCCWRANTDELTTCFIYLEDANAENGCLQVVPGSHLGKPIYPFKDDRNLEVDPTCIDQAKVVAPPLKAGDMIFFDPYLLHYSDVNRSQSRRRAIIYTYNPARLGKVNEGRFPKDGV